MLRLCFPGPNLFCRSRFSSYRLIFGAFLFWSVGTHCIFFRVFGRALFPFLPCFWCPSFRFLCFSWFCVRPLPLCAYFMRASFFSHSFVYFYRVPFFFMCRFLFPFLYTLLCAGAQGCSEDDGVAQSTCVPTEQKADAKSAPEVPTHDVAAQSADGDANGMIFLSFFQTVPSCAYSAFVHQVSVGVPTAHNGRALPA